MKTLKVMLVATALLLGLNTAQAQTLEEAQTKYTEAMGLVKAKDYSNAATMLDEAMNIGFELGDEGLDIVKEIQKILPKVYIYGGVEKLRKSDFQSAITELTSAFELADLYGDITTARQASRAISGAYQAMGAEAFNNKDYQTALTSFSKGYEQDPSNIKLALLTAKSYAELNKIDTAFAIYNDIIKTGTENSKFEAEAAEAKNEITTYSLVAISAAAEAKNLDEVLRIAALAPESPEVALMSMQVANNNNKYDVIIANAEAAAEKQVDDAQKSDIYYMLGVAYNNTQNFDKAIAALSKVTAGNNVSAAKTLITELKK